MPPQHAQAVCPDPAVYSRLNRAERLLAVHEQSRKTQEREARDTAKELDRLCDRVTVLVTTLKVWGVVVGIGLAVAGLVIGYYAIPK